MPLIFLLFHLQLILYNCNTILLSRGPAYFFIPKCSFEWNFTFLLLLKNNNNTHHCGTWECCGFLFISLVTKYFTELAVWDGFLDSTCTSSASSRTFYLLFRSYSADPLSRLSSRTPIIIPLQGPGLPSSSVGYPAIRERIGHSSLWVSACTVITQGRAGLVDVQ